MRDLKKASPISPPSPADIAALQTLRRDVDETVHRVETSKSGHHPVADGYDVLRKLGAGGMGEVYLARRTTDRLEVAIKFLTRTDANGEADARFAREARLAYELVHPNLVKIFAIHTGGANPYIVMEYMPGGSLRNRIEEHGQLDLLPVCRLVEQIAEALTFLESRSIVHRDLKPDNVLLDATGRVKLTDFGVAANIRDVGKLTATDQFVGTADYIAPEQRSRLDVDSRADQYSLSVMIYEMLAGRRPLGRFKPIASYRRDLPAQVDAVVARALSEDPEDRFPTVAAFAEAFRSAKRCGQKRRQPRQFKLVVAGAVVVLAIIAGFSTYNWSTHREAREHSANGVANSVANSTAANLREQDFDELMREGKAAEASHQMSKAATAYAQAANLRPKQIAPLLRRAQLLVYMRRNSQAFADLTRALAIDPHSIDAMIGLAAVQLEFGNLRESQQTLSRALTLAPDQPLGLAVQGALLFRIGNTPAALVKLDEALQADPECAAARRYRAAIHLEKKDYIAAKADLLGAVHSNPDDLAARQALALFLATCPDSKQRNGKAAVEYALDACRANDFEDWEQVATLAAAFAEAGDFQAAQRRIDQANALARTPKERDAVRQFRSDIERRANPL